MIPRLYSNNQDIKNEEVRNSNGLGLLKDTIECFVEEERNGLFDLTLIIPVGSFLFEEIKRGNIIKANANDRLKNQLFRIRYISKPMNGKVKVFARHISFDLSYDSISSIHISKQPCEYALNEIFRQSKFCKHYNGYSDIEMTSNYHMERVSCMDGIVGKQGSIIQTYGNGADILRDNFDFHVLKNRGKDKNVLIAYGKNLTGFTLDEDEEDLVTRIYPFATFRNENQEDITITIKNEFVDSPRVSNYAHPYSKWIDFSDKFDDNEVPTEKRLIELCEKYFRDNKCDIPKLTYKINFIPLSKTENYKDFYELEDIGLCDKVHIFNSKYNLKDQAKVIKYKYDVLNEKYISIELGDPKTTLGDLIGDSSNDSVTKNEVQSMINNTPSTNYPNTLPSIPIIKGESYFGSISLSWTFEDKVYYTYEVYASQIKGFNPSAFNLIFKGQASSYLFSAEPNQTWYFRIRAVNSHGRATDLSEELEVSTFKISDSTTYFEEAAIKDATIGELRLDRGWVGQLKGHHIDARLLTVTDGNGKRTLDIDSYGNINMDVSSLKVASKNVLKAGESITDINVTPGNVKINADKIQLDGTTTVGGEGRHIRIKENDICYYENSTEYEQDLKLEIGFQENDFDPSTYVPKIRMGCYGINPEAGVLNEGNYVLMHHMPKGANPHDSSTDAFAITHRNKLSKNWNGYRSFGNGKISLISQDSIVELSGKDGVRLTSNTYFGYLSGDIVNCRAFGNGGTTLMHNSLDGNNKNLGWSGSKFNQVSAKSIWGDTGSISDIRTKKNIRYLDDEIRTISEGDISSKSELLNFIKKIKICEYNYKEEFKFDDKANNKIGFIANDVVGDKVGDKIVSDHEGYLTYNINNLLFTTIGALQEEIKLRDKQINKLENKLNDIIEIFKI